MADGPPEPDPDDGGQPEDGPILAPEELDITDDEHVEQLDEGRFVVSPDARAGSTERPTQPEPGPPGESDGVDERPAAVDSERVHEWLRDSFEDNPSRYGFDVTATFDDSVSQRRMASNDVVTIFESLMLWYAQQVDSDTPVEEILGILLMESNVPVRYPPESLRNLVKSTDLGPDDSIADLLAAVEDDDGVKL